MEKQIKLRPRCKNGEIYLRNKNECINIYE